MDDGSDEAAKALYDERKKLLQGLMMPEAEPWEDLPEEVKERWRHKCKDSSKTQSPDAFWPRPDE